MSLHNKLLHALVKSGRARHLPAGHAAATTRRYTVLERLAGDPGCEQFPTTPPTYWYIGKAGALRYGMTIAGSRSCGPKLKQRLIDAAGGA